MLISVQNPILFQRAHKVHRFDEFTKSIADEMFSLMKAMSGVGLAAPQIGIGLRLFVAEVDSQKVVMANPEIIKRSGSQVSIEGCLSIQGARVQVKRPKTVEVRGQSLTGKSIKVKASDLLACVLCHEIDHLDGILIPTRGAIASDHQDDKPKGINNSSEE